MSSELKQEKDAPLTKTISALRLKGETFEFYERLRRAQRRERISETIRIVLEDYAAANANGESAEAAT